MNNNRVTISKYTWVAMAGVFVAIFSYVWLSSSSTESINGSEAASSGQGIGERVYREHIANEPPVAVVKATQQNPIIQGISSIKQPAKSKRPPKITPRDMFPMGDITRDLPKPTHPYRQISELFPSFEYEGRLWEKTGKYINAWEADLTPTGYQLATGQKLYALANTSAPDNVLFVQSTMNPNKFAVYRRT